MTTFQHERVAVRTTGAVAERAPRSVRSAATRPGLLLGLVLTG